MNFQLELSQNVGPNIVEIGHDEGHGYDAPESKSQVLESSVVRKTSDSIECSMNRMFRSSTNTLANKPM